MNVYDQQATMILITIVCSVLFCINIVTENKKIVIASSLCATMIILNLLKSLF